MPNVNIRQFRDTRKLKAWLRAGKTVELRERNKVITRIIPARGGNERSVKYSDFAARAKKVFGSNRILPGADMVIEEGAMECLLDLCANIIVKCYIPRRSVLW